MELKEYTKQKGSFLKAEDVIKNPTALWEIKDEGEMVTSEKFGNTRLHISIVSGNEERTFDCSKTNARTIEEALKTSDTNKWIGKHLVFETYKTKTSEGKLTEAVNVKAVN